MALQTCDIHCGIPALITESNVELSRETAQNVGRILYLLEGNKFRPGLIQMVQSNRTDVKQLKLIESHSSVSTNTLAGAVWLGAVLFLFPATVLMVGEARTWHAGRTISIRQIAG